MNDFYATEEVLPEFVLSVKELSAALEALIIALRVDAAKARENIEHLEKDPRRDGMQSPELKHAKSLFEFLQKDIFDAGLWASRTGQTVNEEITMDVLVVITPGQARWLFRYQAHESIRHRLRK